MNLNNTFSYSYTNTEMKRIFLILNDVNLGSYILVSAMSVVLVLKNSLFTDRNSIILAVFITILFIAYSAYCFTKLYKSAQNLKAVQRIYVLDDLFYYENGKTLYKVKIKYLSKVKELKNYYVLKVAYNKFDEEIDFPILPYIPCRVISKEEVQRLACELNINFKERLSY